MRPTIGGPRAKALGAGAVAAVFWIGVWQLVAMAIGSSVLVVGPVPTVTRLLELSGEADFYVAVLQSIVNIVLGFVLALLLGVMVAFTGYFLWPVRILVHPMVRFMRVVPVASLTILILVFMSSQYLPIVVAFLMVFPLVYLNVWEGIEHTSGELREMSTVFGVPILRQVRSLYLPAARPYIIAAYVTGFGYAWKSAVTAEVISSATNSIGAHLNDAKVYLDMPELFAWTLVIVLLASLTERLAVALLPGGQALSANAARG